LRGGPLPSSDDLEAHGKRAGAFPLNGQRCAARAAPFKNEKGGGGGIEIPPWLTTPTGHPPVSVDGTRSFCLQTDLLVLRCLSRCRPLPSIAAPGKAWNGSLTVPDHGEAFRQNDLHWKNSVTRGVKHDRQGYGVHVFRSHTQRPRA
jgi:hypothetical protein